MKSLDDELAASRDRPAFANGTEGEAWTATWCARCVHDTPEKIDRGEGCPLILVSLLGRTPVQWLDGPRDEQGRYGLTDQYHCIEFRDTDDNGGDDDRPDPDPVPHCGGQLALWSTEAVEGPLEYLPMPALLEVAR